MEHKSNKELRKIIMTMALKWLQVPFRMLNVFLNDCICLEVFVFGVGSASELINILAFLVKFLLRYNRNEM